MKQLNKNIDFEVNIICLNQNNINGDLMLCNLAKKLLQLANINAKLIKYKDIGVEETWKEISKLDFFVSVRLHGAITAYLNKVPFYLYEYHEKCTEFLNFIGEETHKANSLNNTSIIANKILDSITSKNNLMDVKCFEQLSKLNITENPLYIKR